MTTTLLIGLQTSTPYGQEDDGPNSIAHGHLWLLPVIAKSQARDTALIHFPEQVYQGFTWLRRCCAKGRKQMYVFLNEKIVLAEGFLIIGLSRLLMLPLVSCEHSGNDQDLA